MKPSEFADAINEAKRTVQAADQATLSLLKIVRGRLRTLNPKGIKNSTSHMLLLDLKKELSDYDGKHARWKDDIIENRMI